MYYFEKKNFLHCVGPKWAQIWGKLPLKKCQQVFFVLVDGKTFIFNKKIVLDNSCTQNLIPRQLPPHYLKGLTVSLRIR